MPAHNAQPCATNPLHPLAVNQGMRLLESFEAWMDIVRTHGARERNRIDMR